MTFCQTPNITLNYAKQFPLYLQAVPAAALIKISKASKKLILFRRQYLLAKICISIRYSCFLFIHSSAIPNVGYSLSFAILMRKKRPFTRKGLCYTQGILIYWTQRSIYFPYIFVIRIIFKYPLPVIFFSFYDFYKDRSIFFGSPIFSITFLLAWKYLKLKTKRNFIIHYMPMN